MVKEAVLKEIYMLAMFIRKHQRLESELAFGRDVVWHGLHMA